MKKTLLLSLGTCALLLSGCGKEDQPGDTSTTVGEDEVGTDGTDTAEGEGTDGTDTNTTSAGTDDATDEGLSFVPEDDFANVSECDPFAQDCPDGEKCVPYASDGGNVWNANKCVQVTGDGAVGDTCTWGGIVEATDDCGTDSICWDVMDVDGQALGVCTEYCAGTADDPVCPPQTSCIIINEGSINLCITNCDPLLQDCGAGLACFWANTAFSCIFTAGDIPTGEPCGFINDCAAGNLCADAATLPACNGSACCTPYCDLVDPTCTVAGTECTSFFEEGMAPPGYEDVGVCVIPA
ncbi:ribulose phosphate epimerase [Nannocystaceae bacterium ST9]